MTARAARTGLSGHVAAQIAPTAPRRAVHDGGVGLDRALRGGHRAPPGVEVARGLEPRDGLHDGVEGLTIAGEHRPGGLEGAREARLRVVLTAACRGVTGELSRSAVDDDRRDASVPDSMTDRPRHGPCPAWSPMAGLASPPERRRLPARCAAS